MSLRHWISYKGAPLLLLWLCLCLAEPPLEELGWLEPQAPSAMEAPSAVEPPEAGTLRCHRRMYHARVERKDALGRKCWDILSLPACWGRCDSAEISEWKFPYKKSKHPVCSFASHDTATTILSHCDPEVSPGTEVFIHARPGACRCHACEGLHTTCGWLPKPMLPHED